MILTYHEVVPEQSPYRYSASCSQLDEHLRLAVEIAGAHALEFTFDDGHASNHRHALPLLEKHGVRATFFVTVGWIGVRPEYMTWTQLQELTRLGHTVQSHTWSHPFLTQCRPDQLADELRRSKTILEDRLGAQVEALSLPGGRWNKRVIDASLDTGYRRIYHSNPWSETAIRRGVQFLGRLMVLHTMDAAAIRCVLEMNGGARVLARLRFRMRMTPRLLLGDNLYHRLWRRLASSASRDEISRAYHS